jgi:hypothetical protein
MPRTRDAAAGLESQINLMARERQAHVDTVAAASKKEEGQLGSRREW